MSMIGNYRRITPQQLADLQREPESIMEFLYPDWSGLPAMWEPVERMLEPDDVGIDGPDFHAPDRYLDVDKAWHGIHFLLTGEAGGGALPLRNAVLGGTKLGDVDVGYGPARFLTPDEVKKVAEALSNISEDDLRAGYDPSALEAAEIYPTIWEREGDEALEYLMDNYVELVEFFQEAARCGDAMLLYLN
jgi:hypothetical protein